MSTSSPNGTGDLEARLWRKLWREHVNSPKSGILSYGDQFQSQGQPRDPRGPLLPLALVRVPVWLGSFKTTISYKTPPGSLQTNHPCPALARTLVCLSPSRSLSSRLVNIVCNLRHRIISKQWPQESRYQERTPRWSLLRDRIPLLISQLL